MGFYCVLTLSPDVPYLFYLKLVKNAKIGNFWGFLGISTSKSGDTVKSGNFGHFCNVARWFKFKITKSWSKTPKSAIFGRNSHPNLVTLLNLNIKTIFYVKMIYNCNCGCCRGPWMALTVWPDDLKQKLPNIAKYYVKQSILSI